MLGAGTEKSVEIDFVTLLSCRSFKYAVFGGVKVQSDLPLIIHKCINKVPTYLFIFHLTTLINTQSKYVLVIFVSLHT